MTGRCAILFTFSLVFYTSSHSQEREKYIYHIEHFTLNDGLPDNRVSEILEDDQGFLWVGTYQGLARFDGYDFEIYRPSAADSQSIGGVSVEALYKDAEGNLWVGGTPSNPGGLSHYNTRREYFNRLSHNPDYNNSLIHNGVVAIQGTSSEPGAIWIAAHSYYDWTNPAGSPSVSEIEGGLSRLDVQSGTFSNFSYDRLNLETLPYLANTLFEDQKGKLWLGGWGLSLLDPPTGSAKTFLPDPDHRMPGPAGQSNNVRVIYESLKMPGKLWVGTSEGFHRFDSETESFSFFSAASESNSKNVFEVHSILEDRTGTLWIGTSKGLFTFDYRSEHLVQFESVPAQTVSSLFEDRFGVIWIGLPHLSGGLIKIERRLNPFTVYQHNPENSNSLANRGAGGIFEDRQGNLWVGGASAVTRIERESMIFTHFISDPNNPYSIPAWGIVDILQDYLGTMWFTACNFGLFRMDSDQPGHFIQYQYAIDDPSGIGRGCANPMLEDRAGNLWISMWGGGVNLIDRKKETFKHFTHDTHGLISDHVLYLYEAPSQPGILWIGTMQGISRFDAESLSVNSFSGERLQIVYAMLEDRRGSFWIGSDGHGLHLFDRTKGVIEQSFTTKDGLAHNVVYAIYEDKQGALWLSTPNGISRFDPETSMFKTFTTRDGLPGNNFREHGHFQSPSGELFFGGPDGVVAFFPDKLRGNPTPPEVLLTNLRINGKPIEIGGSASPLEQSILFTDAITLRHSQNDIRLDFIGLHSAEPHNVRYRYTLNGIDTDWVEAGTQRSAAYPRLPPGDYVFQVRAVSGDGVWSDVDAKMRITILPPWWRTIWAYTLYGMLFITGALILDRIQRRRLIARERLRAEREKAKAIESTNNELQRALKHLTETQDQLVHTEKMASLGQLTAGIAHEIKNPLNFVNNFSTLSVGMLEELKDWIEEQGGMEKPEVRELVETLTMNAAKINEHGQRADGIIRSMLEHSRTGRGERRAVDINKLVDEYVNLSYHGVRARWEGIEVDVAREYDQAIGEIEIYPQEIGRVLINLLDNAFYAVAEKARSGAEGYAPRVVVKTVGVGAWVEVSIVDNGVGIPRGARDKIFDPFFTTKPTGSGTGLGLSLSHDIVVKGHGGELSVESEEGVGAVFLVRLPVPP